MHLFTQKQNAILMLSHIVQTRWHISVFAKPMQWQHGVQTCEKENVIKMMSWRMLAMDGLAMIEPVYIHPKVSWQTKMLYAGQPKR